MISDEGGYAYVAQRWLDGRGLFYQTLWVSRPQGIFVAYGAIQRTLGETVEALRLGAWLASVLTLIFVWRYARSWAGRGTAALTAGLFAPIAPAPSLEDFTANAEVFMAMPSAVLAWLLYRQGAAGWPRGHLLWIGALAGVAALLKPAGVVMLAVALGFVWLEGAAGVRVALRRSVWIATGFAGPIGLALLPGWLIGWDAFVYASVGYRVAHQSSLTVGLTHHLIRLGALWADAWWLTLAVVVPFWGRQRAIHGRLIGGLPEGIRAFLRSAAQPRSLVRRVRNGGRDPGGTLLRLWLLGCLGGMAIGGDWWAHYLIQIAGPLAIGLAILIRDGWPSVARRRPLVAVGLAALLLAPDHVAVRGDADERSLALFHNSGYVVEDEVTAYLRANTSPETPIFVAFNTAAIYYLADRPATYRYFFNQELRAFPTAEAQLVSMLAGPNRPEIVVRTGMPAPFPDGGRAFWEALELYYRVEAVVGGATIYRALELASLPAR
jgi:4-amino-4-deoxy-L-arabinose transferase-like glycosyltransferase